MTESALHSEDIAMIGDLDLGIITLAPTRNKTSA
jgi:hypothetical protein